MQLALTAPDAAPPAPALDAEARRRRRKPRGAAAARAPAERSDRGGARRRGADRGDDGLRPRRRPRDRPAGAGGGARRLPRRRGARRRRLGDRRSPGREQRAALRARLVGEFDRPDAEARAGARPLLRAHRLRRRGAARCSPASRGSTASTTGRCSPISPAWSTAATPAPDGPLALALPLSGPSRALAGARRRRAGVPRRRRASPRSRRPSPSCRPTCGAMLGPRLIGRMLDAARPAEARRLLDTSARDGDAPDAGDAVAEARMLAAEGEPRRRSRGSPALAAQPRPGRARRADAGRRGSRSTPACRRPTALVTDLRAAALSTAAPRASRSCARSSSSCSPSAPSCRPRCARPGRPRATCPARGPLRGAGGAGLAAADPAGGAAGRLCRDRARRRPT